MGVGCRVYCRHASLFFLADASPSLQEMLFSAEFEECADWETDAAFNTNFDALDAEHRAPLAQVDEALNPKP